MENFKKGIVCAMLCLVVMIGAVVILWGILMFGAYVFSPNPPAPQTTYGEFPFRLEYELDGKSVVVEDIYVCEFNGYDFNAGTGEKYRKWKGYFKGGNTRITLLIKDGVEVFYFPVYPSSSGLAGKYMGDPEYTFATAGNFPDAQYTIDFEDKTVGRYKISADEMWEKYKLRLISWECAPPIENNFK